jgi:hypothetical protein
MRPVGEDGRPGSALSKLLSAEERKDKYVVQSTGRLRGRSWLLGLCWTLLLLEPVFCCSLQILSAGVCGTLRRTYLSLRRQQTERGQGFGSVQQSIRCRERKFGEVYGSGGVEALDVDFCVVC